MIPLKKKSELEVVLHLLSNGFTKEKIRNKLNLKITALSNRLRRLEDLGCIERKGKYIINVLRSSVNNPKATKNQIHKKLNKRGHAYNFKIIFPKEENLKKKKKVMNEFKLNKIEKLSFGSYKLKKDKNTIWINKGSLTIYSSNSYYSKNALHSKFRALKDVDNLIYYLRGRFDFKGFYGIEIFREHYGLIFNKFAKWLLNKGRKMYVRNHGNKAILWIDNSRKDDIGLEEFEGDDPQRVNLADKYFESHEKTDWKVTPESTLKHQEETKKEITNLKGVFPAMKEYNENLKLHTSVNLENKELLKQNINLSKMNQETQSQIQLLLTKLNNKL